MASSLGSLVVDISANVAKFQLDMSKVAALAEESARRIDSAFGAIGKTSGVLALIAITVEATKQLGEMATGAIEAAASLEKLSQRTGATVEGLANLSATAKLSNTDNDQLAVGLQKLSKSMIDAANGGVKTSAAFEAIGISVQDLAGRKPDEVFRLIAQRLAAYQDGAEKVALAQLLMGKSGANMLPLLHDLADGGEIQSRVTAEQAKQAEAFEKNLRRLSVTFTENRNAIVQQFLPALSALSEGMLAAQRAGAGLLQTLISLPLQNLFASITDTPVQERIDAIRITIKNLEEAAAHPYPGQTAEGLATIARQAVAAKAELAGLLAQQRATALAGTEGDLSDQITRRLGAATKPIIRIRVEGRSDEKAIRDAALKDLDRSIASEHEVLTQREQFLHRYYASGDLELKDYFDARRTAIEENLRTVQADYAKEISEAEKFATERKSAEAAAAKRFGATPDESEIAAVAKIQGERVAAEEKVRELRDKSAKAERDATLAGINLGEDRIQVTQKQKEAEEALQIEILNLTGRYEEAAAAQAKLTIEQIKYRGLSAEGRVRAEEIANRIELANEANIKQKQITELEQREAIIENRIALQQQTGAIGTITALQLLGTARQAEIADLEKLIAAQDRLAAETGTPEAILRAQELHLKLDQLKADVDPLGAKLEGMFETAFADNFAKVIDGTESVRSAFSNMVRSIQSELSKLVAQDISKQIFGSGGFGGLLSGLFNLGGGGTGLAAGQAGPPANLAGPGGASGFFASLLSFLPKFQEGGMASAGSAYLVGERGPELFMPRSSGTVAPTGSFGNTTIHVHMAAGQSITRDSANLLGATVARHLSAVSQRNN